MRNAKQNGLIRTVGKAYVKGLKAEVRLGKKVAKVLWNPGRWDSMAHPKAQAHTMTVGAYGKWDELLESRYVIPAEYAISFGDDGSIGARKIKHLGGAAYKALGLPNEVSFKSAEEALTAALEEEELSRPPRGAFEGGFYERMGRLPTGDVAQYDLHAIQAKFYTTLAAMAERYLPSIGVLRSATGLAKRNPKSWYEGKSAGRIDSIQQSASLCYRWLNAGDDKPEISHDSFLNERAYVEKETGAKLNTPEQCLRVMNTCENVIQEQEARRNPGQDGAELAMELTEAVGKAQTKRQIAKYGAMAMATKMGVKAVPGIGEAVMVYEAGRSGVRDIRHIKSKAAGRYDEVANAKGWKKKAKAFSRGAAGSMTETAAMGLRSGLAAVTSADLAEKIIKRNPKGARANPLARAHVALLRKMSELRLAYQLSHWNADKYANHLLFERLYQSLDSDLDTWAELLLVGGDKLSPGNLKPPTDLLEAEVELGTLASSLITERLPKSLENFLLNFIQNRRRAVYLLRQA